MVDSYSSSSAGNGSQAASQYTCPWCGAVSDGSSLSCPSCGATINVKAITSRSGWSEVPGRKDMAHLQIGNSSCQIEGKLVPVADMNLAGGDSVYFAHHVLLWKDPKVEIKAMSLKGAWKRMLAGMPVIMTTAHGPGHVAFSRDAPGELIALPIQPGHSVDVREHLMLVATSQVAYDWFPTNVWFTTRNGDDSETHYPLGMFMDRFSAGRTPGLVLLHASGNVFVRQLTAGESILVKPTALIFKDSSVSMQLYFEMPNVSWQSWGVWGERYLWLELHGPGRIALQSAFEAVEDDGSTITRASPAHQQRW